MTLILTFLPLSAGCSVVYFLQDMLVDSEEKLRLMRWAEEAAELGTLVSENLQKDEVSCLCNPSELQAYCMIAMTSRTNNGQYGNRVDPIVDPMPRLLFTN